jgi:hypothetical protein
MAPGSPKTTPKIITKKSQADPNMASNTVAESTAQKMEFYRNKIIQDTQKKGGAKIQATTKSSVFTKSFADILTVTTPVPPPASNGDYTKLARPPGLTVPAMGSFVGTKAQEGWSSRPTSTYGASKTGASNFGGSTYASNNKTVGQIHDAADYREGMIFTAPFHQHDYLQPDTVQSREQSMTEFGVVHTKLRKFVVVMRNPRAVIALPIYTHGGRGLEFKKEKNEFVSIRESDWEDSAAPAESDNGIVWADALPAYKRPEAGSWGRMTDRTSVLLTHPHPHYFDRKATFVAQLLPESISKIKTLYRAWNFGEAAPTPAVASAPKELFPTSAPKELFPSGTTRNRAAESSNWLSSRSQVQGRTPSGVYAPRR